MESERHSIDISDRLYRELREYCDLNGLRFAEFVEEALETATYRDEMERLLRNDAEIKLRVETARSRALGEGFTRGVAALFLAMGGSLLASKKQTPLEAEKTVFYQPVTGPQLPLFDSRD